MWEKTNNPYQPADSYKNLDPASPIKGIVSNKYSTHSIKPFSSEVCLQDVQQVSVLLKPGNDSIANKIHDQTILANPSITHGIDYLSCSGPQNYDQAIDCIFHKEGHFVYNNISVSISASFILQQHIDIFFRCLEEDYGISTDILDEIKQKITPRTPSPVEQQFYELLTCLSADNFDKLLQLATESYNQNHSSPLQWELAVACREQGLINEYQRSLLSITRDTNFYSKAQGELFWHKLSDICDQEHNGTTFNKEQLISALKNLAQNQDEEIIINYIKKLTFLFLDQNPFQEDNIFVDFHENNPQSQECENFFFYYLADLLDYTKKLQQENNNLQQQLATITEQAPSNDAASTSYSKPRPRI